MALAPAGRVAMVSLMPPLPLAAHTAPPVAVHDQVALLMPVGSGSDTTTLEAAAVPTLLTTIV